MEKLKKAKVTITICPTCKGNGYLKVATEGKDQVHQCWDCDRSEEHTSELQSQSTISYAVFCLKKKNKTSINTLRRKKKARDRM